VKAVLGERLEYAGRRLRVLDFDTECRPLAWYGGDFVTKQPTALAWRFIDEGTDTEVAYIGASDRSSKVLEEEAEMLMAFRDAFTKADVVTGHFILGFDLPLVNGSLIRLGLPQLPDTLAQDTKIHFAKAQGMSKSQENLGRMFGLQHPKVPMDTDKWGRANMLLPDGIDETVERVVGDVNQHVELRQTMLDRGLLRAPTPWSGGASGKGTGGYTP
jgi:hypothetical protein